VNSSVALVRCTSFAYDEHLVEEAVRRSVDLLGGMDRFVSPGQRVLLKPNLLRSASPEDLVCTHPAVVKAMVKMVQEAGGHPVIGDSPGGPFVAAWLRSIYNRSGMTRVAEETGAELNWDFGETLLSHPDGRRVKAIDIGTYLTKADVVISLPKLKTHGFMQLTGATKNMFGAIPGTAKLGYHAKVADPPAFGDMLIDILTLVPPALTVMDGVVAMDGQGPSAGDPFQMGVILASTDGIAMDMIVADLVGMDPHHIYPLRAAIERGLVPASSTEIDVLGDPLSELRVEGFRSPGTHTTDGRVIEVLGRLVANWFVASPHSNDNCIGCGICADNCPVDAISIIDQRAQMDLKTCIRCYCCHELCPHNAIDLRRSWIARLIS